MTCRQTPGTHFAYKYSVNQSKPGDQTKQYPSNTVKEERMSEETSTPVSKDPAFQKGWLHRFLIIYEIVIIVLAVLVIVILWKHFVGSQEE